MGEEILRQMYTSSGTSLGQAFLYAQRACMLKYPQYRDFFKSYVLLGDPFLGGGSEPTAVQPTQGGLDFRLEAPWPNPAGRGSTIRYVLAKASLVSVRIFDVHGRLLRSLAQEELQGAGSHVVSWDARTLRGVKVESGVYFIKVSTDKQTRTRKIVIVN